MRHKSVTERAEMILLRVIDRILEEPKRVHMSDWLWNKEEILSELQRNKTRQELYNDPPLRGSVRFLPQCGIVGCIAGWTVIEGCRISKKKMDYERDDVRERAGRILGLKNVESGDYYDDIHDDRFLFIPDEWPEPYRTKLENEEPQTKAYAKVVASRIRYYIRTGK